MPRFRPKTQTEVEAQELQFALDMTFPDGTSQKVQPGDYLVTFPSGEQKIMDRAEFLSLYDPVKKMGRKPKSETE